MSPHTHTGSSHPLQQRQHTQQPGPHHIDCHCIRSCFPCGNTARFALFASCPGLHSGRWRGRRAGRRRAGRIESLGGRRSSGVAGWSARSRWQRIPVPWQFWKRREKICYRFRGLKWFFIWAPFHTCKPYSPFILAVIVAFDKENCSTQENDLGGICLTFLAIFHSFLNRASNSLT